MSQTPLEGGGQERLLWLLRTVMNSALPTGCILRHAKAILEGDTTDSDSGLDHFSHVVCDLIMLAWFVDHYKEGANRPPLLPFEFPDVGCSSPDPVAPGRFTPLFGIDPRLISPVIGVRVMEGG